ncbi:MAG TPA: S1/P1 nuclease, partial [Chitinophagaceae bacterium]
MNKFIRPVFLVLTIAVTVTLLSWGRWGHQHINRAAVFALPDSMRVFFYNHIDYITEESSVPDSRRGLIGDKAEPNRHFIDLENYLTHPGDSMPQTLKEASDKFDAKFIEANGILPWYMEDMMEKLTRAFRNKSKVEILFIAADLAHYIGDAHMPLHTSANYDGQFTNQKGIHSFW